MGCGATAKACNEGKYAADATTEQSMPSQPSKLIESVQSGRADAGQKALLLTTNQTSPIAAEKPITSSCTDEKLASSSPHRATNSSMLRKTSAQVAASSPKPDLAVRSSLANQVAVTASPVSDTVANASMVHVRTDASASQQRPKSKGGLERRADLLTDIYKRYEADASAALAAGVQKSGPQKPMEPLVSPERVQLVAHILGADLARESFLVPAAKLLLSSSLAIAVRETGRVAESNVQHGLDLFTEYRLKEAQSSLPANVPASADAMLCVDCSMRASLYCPDCEDTFCDECFKKFHAKGNRTKHVRLDVYMVGYKVKEMSGTLEGHLQAGRQPEKNLALLLNRWHPFSDAQGLRFFYNYESEKAVRKIPEDDIARPPPPPLPSVR